MSKLVILELDGDLEDRGFRVTLEIGSDGSYTSQTLKIKGVLPANPELAESSRSHWQDKYRLLGNSTRIKSKKIIHKGSINKRLAECIESANQFTDRLNAWLKSEQFREIDNHLREELHRDEAIRFLIRAEDMNVHKLPWQQWDFFKRYPKAEVALSPLECKSAQRTSSSLPKSKVRILAILGDREGIDVEKDLQILKGLPHIELTFLTEPDHKEINDQLWEQAWDIIFFAGHSKTQGETGRIYINSEDSLTVQELWYGLRKAVERGLKLAIFNSCDGLGLARQLDDLHIPQMIVMRESIPDLIAQEFLKHFLTAFASGQPLYLAVREARQRLHDDLEREFPCASWLPVICQHPAEVPPTWNELLGQIGDSDRNFSTTNWLSHYEDVPLNLKKRRTLAAILFTDAVGFSHRMAQNEDKTLDLLSRDLKVMAEFCQHHQGYVLKSTGDGLLMYFASAIQAVTCAVAIQKSLGNSVASDRLLHRIGIHLGDVLFNDGDVMGNGVNIAARLESEADPGGILISQTVYEVVRNNLAFPAIDRGKRWLKNIPEPVQTYQIVLDRNYRPLKQRRIFNRNSLKTAFLSSIVATIVVMGLRSLGIFQTLELKTLDRFLQWRPAEGTDSRLLVVEATEEDINRYGFPLPDEVLVTAMQKLQVHQPRVIALDIFRENPSAPLRRLLQQNNRAIAVCSASEVNNPNKSGMKPPPEVSETQLGFTDVLVDGDGILRRHLMFMQPPLNDPCVTDHAFSTRIAFHYLAAEGIEPRLLSRQKVQIGRAIFRDIEVHPGGYQKLDDGGFQVMLNYRQDVAKTIKISDVLAGQIDPNLVQNRIVLLGVTAPISSDNFSTPYSDKLDYHERLPGVLVQAQQVSQILSAVLDGRPLLGAWSPWGEAIWVWGWTLVGSAIVLQGQKYWISVVGMGMVLSGVSWILLLGGIWAPVVPTMMALAGGSAIAKVGGK